MMQTIEAVIDEKGNIRLLEAVRLKAAQRVLVTILPVSDKPDNRLPTRELSGLGEILDDDLEGASRDIANTFRNALEFSSNELENQLRTMSVFVTDTHPIIWFTLKKRSALSDRVLTVFESAEAGQAFIYIPAIVFWEAAQLERAGKIKLYDGFLRWAQALLNNSGFGIAPLGPEVIALGAGYNFNGDPFDETIAAYSAHMDLPLITKDSLITNSGLIETFW